MKLQKLLFTFLMLSSTLIFAQDEKTEEEWEAEEAALAKATQNPLAAMYSLPLQNNTTYNMGEFGRAQNVLNIQPVIPIGLGDKVNLINRIIFPVITQPSFTEDKSSTSVGDIVYTARNKEEFQNLIHEALEENEISLKHRRIEIAKQNANNATSPGRA